MSDLRPCPNLWCKRNDVAVHGPDMVSDTYCVGCECGIGGPECATESEAVSAWNHRPVEDALAKARKLAQWKKASPENLPKKGQFWVSINQASRIIHDCGYAHHDWAVPPSQKYLDYYFIAPPQPEKPSTTA